MHQELRTGADKTTWSQRETDQGPYVRCRQPTARHMQPETRAGMVWKPHGADECHRCRRPTARHIQPDRTDRPPKSNEKQTRNPTARHTQPELRTGAEKGHMEPTWSRPRTTDADIRPRDTYSRNLRTKSRQPNRNKKDATKHAYLDDSTTDREHSASSEQPQHGRQTRGNVGRELLHSFCNVVFFYICAMKPLEYTYV